MEHFDKQTQVQPELHISPYPRQDMNLDHLKALVFNPAFRVMWQDIFEYLQGQINQLCSEEEVNGMLRKQGAIDALNRVVTLVPQMELELREKENNNA